MNTRCRKILLLLAFWGCFCRSSIIGQTDTENHDVTFTIPTISLVDVEPATGSITLSLTPPSDAGQALSASSVDQSKWLNYTVSLSPTAAQQLITAQITAGSLPDGLALQLSASNYSGVGSGQLGTPQGSIQLTNLAQPLIGNIGGSFTGNGVANGHQLTYSLVITDYASLQITQSGTVEVTYTITEQ
ncbi:MAG: hypothetical protein AAGJ18_18490 [Bacteroidota bacterium]